jgi:8-oxo-dGTP pyrophosphatase MutT (NUDIX family)
MELWDVYDCNRVRTGRTAVRGKPLLPGEYHLVVHIWIQNGRGEYLIQKRAPTVGLAPGLWASTGGSALAGEDSRDAFLREAREELGLDLSDARAQVAATITNRDWITDVWTARCEAAAPDLLLQKEEVSEARWASYDEIVKMTGEGSFWKYSYLEALPGMFKKTEDGACQKSF